MIILLSITLVLDHETEEEDLLRTASVTSAFAPDLTALSLSLSAALSDGMEIGTGTFRGIISSESSFLIEE